MWREEPTCPNDEELRSLFRKLLKGGSKYIESLGCTFPDQCATDALTEYLFDRGLRGAGRGQITGEFIRLDFPGAKNQLKVLNSLVRQELKGKHSHCRDCKYRNRFCPLPDDSADGEDEGRRAAGVDLPGPKTPEEIFEAKEALEGALRAAQNPEQRRRIIKKAMGFSSKEIAQQSGADPRAVRKESSRYRKRLRLLAGKAFRRRHR